MPWFKVDDKLHDHRKAEAAGCEAMGLWVLAGSWSADNLTDGFVPRSKAARWTGRLEEHAAALVAAGLWEPAERKGAHGWVFRNWKKFQPTKAKVTRERREAKKRMAAARARKAADDCSPELRANFGGTNAEVPVGTGRVTGEKDKAPAFELDEDGVARPVLRAIGGSV